MNVPFLKDVVDKYRAEIAERDRVAAARRKERMDERVNQLVEELQTNATAIKILEAANVTYTYDSFHNDMVAQAMAFGEAFYLLLQQWTIDDSYWRVICHVIEHDEIGVPTDDLDSELASMLDKLQSKATNAA